jgi:CBS domain containing-hemolysin-like protein
MLSMLVTYFVLALVVSFCCSLFEATLLSINDSHVQVSIRENRPAGHRLAKLRANIDHPLIAILTTNTVANMFGAAGVGAETARIVARRGLTEGVWVGVASAALTFCILVFSEIIPKTLGATYWKSLAGPLSTPIALLTIALKPIIFILERIPRLLTGRAGETAEVSRDEIAVLAEMGHQSGTVERYESRIIANLIGLERIRAKDIMTPRVEVFALHEDETIRAVMETRLPIRYSRIPVFGESKDSVRGFVLRWQLLEEAARGNLGTPVSDLVKPLSVVPETAPVATLLRQFINTREHIALVVDEYGSNMGIVTLEDAIETLLGVEIIDELDIVADLRRLASIKSSSRRPGRGPANPRS